MVEDTWRSWAEEFDLFSSRVIESVLQVWSWILPPLRLWCPNWWLWWLLEWLLLPLLWRDIRIPPFLHDWNFIITKPITTVTKNNAVPTPARIVRAVVWFPEEWCPFFDILLLPNWTCSCFAISSGILERGFKSPPPLSTCVPSAEIKIRSLIEIEVCCFYCLIRILIHCNEEWIYISKCIKYNILLTWFWRFNDSKPSSNHLRYSK